MRDWTVRWVSVVVVIWVYSSSLALSSSSLWLATARYLDLSKSTSTSSRHQRQQQQQSSSSSSSKRAATTSSRTTPSTKIAAIKSRGGGIDYSSGNSLPEYSNNDDFQKDDAIAAIATTNEDKRDLEKQETNALSKLKPRFENSIWLSRRRHQREQNLQQQQRNNNDEKEKGANTTTHQNTSISSSSSSSSSSSIPLRFSKYRWDRLSQRLQHYRRRGNRYVIKNKTLNERQLSYFDRIALVTTAFLNRETEAILENATTTSTAASSTTISRGTNSFWNLRRHKINGSTNNLSMYEHEEEQVDDSWITAQSDLTLPGRHITVVTTAALPWMTGTAVNPLLRAAHLCRRTRILNNSTTQQWVTIVLPWLELTEDQQEVYQRIFTSPQEQEDYIRNWLRNDADLADVADAETGLKIIFYPARYHLGMRSVFAMGDICSLIPNNEADVCILEEPEHCNWFRAPGDGWTRKFHYVVGVVHTNYKEYASAQYHGLWTAPALAVISSAMVRAYCHKVIKLSDVLQTFAPEKEATSNVHGVRSDFLEEGIRRSQEALERKAREPNASHVGTKDDYVNARSGENGVYFIGKLLWAKGLDLLLELEDYYKQCTGEYFPIDIYGSGPDQKEITRAYLGRRKQTKPKQKQHQQVTRPLRNLLWDRRLRFKKPKAIDREAKKGRTMSTSIATALHILGTTFSLEGGTLGATRTATKKSPSTEEQQQQQQQQNKSLEREEPRNHSVHGFDRDGDLLNQSLDDNEEVDTWIASFSSLSTSFKEQSHWAKEHLVKIKESIRTTTESIEIPRTLYELRRQPIPATFPGRVDHSSLKESYKIFVNPSISEVLCTTTAEALAMGKFAIIPVHPSNAFFYQFPNCLAYRNKFEFVANLRWALTHEPEPLTPELAREFSWEAATDRLIEAAAVTWKEARERDKLGMTKLDERIAWLHNELGKGTKGDILRKVMGAGPASNQVKYQIQMQQQPQQLHLLTKAELESLNGNVNNNRNKIAAEGDDQEVDDDSDDNDDEGLTQKFRSSSFVQAIRSTISNGLPPWSTAP